MNSFISLIFYFFKFLFNLFLSLFLSHPPYLFLNRFLYLFLSCFLFFTLFFDNDLLLHLLIILFIFGGESSPEFTPIVIPGWCKNWTECQFVAFYALQIIYLFLILCHGAFLEKWMIYIGFGCVLVDHLELSHSEWVADMQKLEALCQNVT